MYTVCGREGGRNEDVTFTTVPYCYSGCDGTCYKNDSKSNGIRTSRVALTCNVYRNLCMKYRILLATFVPLIPLLIDALQ